MRTIRRTIYRVHGEFVACVSDNHPELAQDAPGPEPQPNTLAIQGPAALERAQHSPRARPRPRADGAAGQPAPDRARTGVILDARQSLLLAFLRRALSREASPCRRHVHQRHLLRGPVNHP
jgi:hypothetical protein